MKKLIRSSSLFRMDTGILPEKPTPKASETPVQIAAPERLDLTTKRQPVTWRQPTPLDAKYTEEYERECIVAAQSPNLPPSVPVVASAAPEAGVTMPKVFRGRERDAIVQAYRRYDRRSSIGLVPLHSGSQWVILEHADGQHTAFNADFGGNPHV